MNRLWLCFGLIKERSMRRFSQWMRTAMIRLFRICLLIGFLGTAATSHTQNQPITTTSQQAARYLLSIPSDVPETDPRRGNPNMQAADRGSDAARAKYQRSVA